MTVNQEQYDHNEANADKWSRRERIKEMVADKIKQSVKNNQSKKRKK